jgi:uncharacterized membrane protein
MSVSLTSSSERDQTADLLKGIAVALMVQVHLVEQFATIDLFQSSVGRVSLFFGGPPAAPVFLAVMGYFLALSRKTLLEHLRRGVFLVIGGVLLNIGLNANLLYSIHQGRFHIDPLAFIFGADILPLAGLSVIVVALLRSIARNNSLAYVSMALLVAATAPFIPEVVSESSPALFYVSPFLWGDSWWSYFPLFPWLAYPLLGVAFAAANINRSVEFIRDKKVQFSIILIVLAALVITLPFAIDNITELHRYYHHGILLMLWNAGFLLVWTKGASWLENVFGQSSILRYLKWLGRHVTSAFVFQWLIIGNLATEFYRTQSLAQTAIWFVIVMLLMSLLVVAFLMVKQRIVIARTSS